jgi:hypothetical protein
MSEYLIARVSRVFSFLTCGLMIAATACGKSAAMEDRPKFSDLHIPAAYTASEPGLHEDFVIVVASYPSMRPYGIQMGAATLDKVRITISKIHSGTEVERLLSDFERLKHSTAPAKPVFVGNDKGFAIYTIRVGSSVQEWKVKLPFDGDSLGFQDPGGASHVLMGNRRFGNMEVTYSFRKGLNVEPMEIDRAVVKLIQTFLQ